MTQEDTIKWLLSLVRNDPWRDIHLRMADDTDINHLREAGLIERVDVYPIDTWPGVEQAIRLTARGREAAYTILKEASK